MTGTVSWPLAVWFHSQSDHTKRTRSSNTPMLEAQVTEAESAEGLLGPSTSYLA
jgi:hypothetical protein